MRTIWIVAALLLGFGARLPAQAPPSDFVSDTVFNSPNGVTALEFDHQGRLLAAEKQGRLVQFQPNGSGGFVTPPTQFANLVSQVVPTFESGLLGMALDPDYANNRYIYLFYTTSTDQRLTRITANTDFSAMQAGSEVVLLSGLPRATFIHNAGDIQFAPADPTAIYVALGDDAAPVRAQNLSFYEGKLLRVDAATGLGLPDNPYYDGNPNSVRSRIFAIGFRNPFRISFHPNASGSDVLYSSENGDGTDRLSWVRAGSNGAWSTGGDGGGFLNPPDPNHRVLSTWAPSVVGVAIANGGPFGNNVIYWGQWQGNIRRWQLSGLDLNVATALDSGGNFRTGHSTIDFQFGPDGHLYSSSTGNDAATGGFFPIRRLRYVGTTPPNAAFATNPDPAQGTAPLLVQFTDQSTAPGSSIASRLWDFGDGSTSSATNPSRSYASPGVYEVQLTVTNSVGQQSSASRIVRATRNVQVSYQGLIRDGRQLPAPPLAVATELRFYQADGSTPAPFAGGLGADGNILAVAAGGSNPQTVTLNLSGNGLVISAGEAPGDGVQSARRGWVVPAGSGPHTLVGDFYLANSLFRGQLRDTRNQPVAGDIGLRRGSGAGAIPYALAGGRDYLPASGNASTGVAHRVVADALGWYHLAVRDADAGSNFRIDAVADTATNSHAAIAVEATLSVGQARDLALQSGIWSGGLACDDLSGIAPTPAVNYASQIQPLWDQGCVGCHTAVATNSGGLDLTAAASLAALVQSPSLGAPGVPRVNSGLVNRSFLFEKINCGEPQTGTRMRPANPMALGSQALIRDWIAQLPPVSGVLFADGFE